MIKQLAPFVGQYKRYAILAPIMVVLEVLFEIAIPYIMSLLVDVGVANGDTSYVLQMGGLMVLLAALALLSGALSARYAARASVGFGANLRAGLFNKIQDFSFKNRDRFTTPSLVTRLTTDITSIQNAFMMSLRLLFRAPVMLVSSLIMAFTINSSLFTVFLVAVPILGLSFFIIITLAFPRFQILLKKYDLLNASIQETLIGIRVVKAFVRATFEKKKFKQSNDELAEAGLRAEKVVIAQMPIMQMVIYLTIIAILWFGGNLVINRTMLTGQLFSFIAYVNQILFSLMMIAMVFINLVLSKAAMSRSVEILNEVIDIRDGEGDPTLHPADASIEFRHVSFRYNDTSTSPVLQNINLAIRSGEKIGILGGTGSAKSTLVQLIPRLYDATEGSVIVGGHDVREYALDTLRDAVGMVLQKNVLFSGSIKDNLRWGNPDASDAAMQEAARAAQAHAFIESFPEQYETKLEQGGVNVSGGQKQRLTIARALLKKPKILILDDSTSAVDTATDAKIREALRQQASETTLLVIAQRITSVMEMDRIVILDEGRIVGIGTHDELMATNAIYQEVYHSQQKGEQ